MAGMTNTKGGIAMRILNRKMRSIAATVGLAVPTVFLAVTMNSASATAESAAAPVFVVRGTAAGGIKVVQTGQTLTFVFTETNKGPGSAPEDLVIKKVSNAKVIGNPPCVLPNGTAINS